MPTQSSLVKRLTLKFMSAVTTVLVVAGVSFYVLSQHHFQMLDEQALAEKLESTRHILLLSTARDEPEDQDPQPAFFKVVVASTIQLCGLLRVLLIPIRVQQHRTNWLPVTSAS